MKEAAEMLLAGLTTLMFSWGSDAPQEVIWGVNEKVEYFNNKYGTNLTILEEDYSNWEDSFGNFILEQELIAIIANTP